MPEVAPKRSETTAQSERKIHTITNYIHYLYPYRNCNRCRNRLHRCFRYYYLEYQCCCIIIIFITSRDISRSSIIDNNISIINVSMLSLIEISRGP